MPHLPQIMGVLMCCVLLGCGASQGKHVHHDRKSHVVKAEPEPMKRVEPHKTTHPYHYLYGLSGYKFADLMGKYAADILVVDVDDAQLDAMKVRRLRQTGKTVYSYLSIGEAENYRSYWRGWEKNKPTFLLDENKDWKGNYRVKFWDKAWQQVIFRKVDEIVRMGFNGVYLDIIDGYQQKSVIAAYPGNKTNLRQEMENFVIRISNYAKKINPNFKIIPQNAVELLADPSDGSQPNQNYLAAIDGLGVESLWYSDDEVADWTKWDLKKIRHASNAGKFVLATSYPTDPAKQKDFLNKARTAGFIGFAGKRSLSKSEEIYPVNRKLR